MLVYAMLKECIVCIIYATLDNSNQLLYIDEKKIFFSQFKDIPFAIVILDNCANGVYIVMVTRYTCIHVRTCNISSIVFTLAS